MLEQKIAQLPDRPIRLPANLADRFLQFLLDKGTGNVELNVKDGRILGMKLTEMHRPDTF